MRTLGRVLDSFYRSNRCHFKFSCLQFKVSYYTSPIAMASTSAQHPVHSTATPSAPAQAVTTNEGAASKKAKKEKGGKSEGNLEVRCFID